MESTYEQYNNVTIIKKTSQQKFILHCIKLYYIVLFYHIQKEQQIMKLLVFIYLRYSNKLSFERSTSIQLGLSMRLN